MHFDYKTRGVCSSAMHFDLEDNIIKNLEIVGGCHGNSQGVAALVEGMDADEVIRRLKGIGCGYKETSCPDQLALALEQAKAKAAEK